MKESPKLPLSSLFTVISIIGFIAFFIYTSNGKIDPTWGFTMILIFGIMLVASLVAMYPADKPKRIKRK